MSDIGNRKVLTNESVTLSLNQTSQPWIKAGNNGVIGWQSGESRSGSSLTACFEVITTVTNKGIKISFSGWVDNGQPFHRATKLLIFNALSANR